MVADPCHPVTWEAEISRIKVQGQHRQAKFIRPHLNQKQWWHMPVLPATQESAIRGIVVTGTWSIK
jgi:hypothetical protein